MRNEKKGLAGFLVSVAPLSPNETHFVGNVRERRFEHVGTDSTDWSHW